MTEDRNSKGDVDCSIAVHLAGCWEDVRHTVSYHGLAEYNLTADAPFLTSGHGDWRYDEFRVDDGGLVIHEIEWGDGASWVIKCRDIEHAYIDKRGEQNVEPDA